MRGKGERRPLHLKVHSPASSKRGKGFQEIYPLGRVKRNMAGSHTCEKTAGPSSKRFAPFNLSVEKKRKMGKL